MKKNSENIQVQVGAFLALGILLFMMAVFMLGSKSSLFQSYYVLQCYFDDISGLRVGAPVQLAGINVGYIDTITFEDIEIQPAETAEGKKTGPDETAASADQITTKVKVKVTMKIDKKFQDRIRSDSKASVVTQGLLGDRMIYLTVGTPWKLKKIDDKLVRIENKVLSDGDYITEVMNPTGFTEIVAKGDDLMIDAKEFVNNTNEFVTKLNLIAGEVVEGQGLVHEVIFDRSSADTLVAVNDILHNLENFSGNLSSISGKINSGQGTLGALVNDDSLYRDFKTLMGKANRNKLIRSVIRYTLETKEKEQLK